MYSLNTWLAGVNNLKCVNQEIFFQAVLKDYSDWNFFVLGFLLKVFDFT